jgi:glycosyltransferase involved in cell wall biosynthesis
VKLESCYNSGGQPKAPYRGFVKPPVLPVVVYFAERRGPAAARNEGIKKPKGDYLLSGDADCFTSGNLISKHINTHLRLVGKNRG